MARRGSSFGFFGLFGRSEDLRRLDEALRACDLHPALVPEGAKLAIVNLMKDHAEEGEPPPHAYPYVAALVAYCLVGPEAYAAANGEAAVPPVEARMAAAAENGEGLDAELVLLVMHARLIRPDVVERFGLSIDEA